MGRRYNPSTGVVEVYGDDWVNGDFETTVKSNKKKVKKKDDNQNRKDTAAQTSNRLDLSLFPQSAIIYGALAMFEGHLKYGGYNYRAAGVASSVYIAALMRHMIKYYNGEWADGLTGVPHLASMMACVAILVDGHEQDNLIDDRPPAQDNGDLFTVMEDLVGGLRTLYSDRGGERFTEEGEL